MVFTVVGGVLGLLGAIMMVRGWVYSLRPDGPMALKRKSRNIELGFPTDMRLFGRKVRRMGTILVVVAAAMIGSQYL